MESHITIYFNLTKIIKKHIKKYKVLKNNRI